MLLYGGVLTRLGKVDPPVSSHGNEAPVSWPCRSGWTFPGIWLAAGDFNANLAERLSWISTAFVLRSEGPWFLGRASPTTNSGQEFKNQVLPSTAVEAFFR